MRVTLAATCALALLTLPACIGYDRMLFTTKSNVGVDLDSTPPTFDVTIARREVVIEPTFDNAETLPVMASFSSKRTSSVARPHTAARSFWLKVELWTTERSIDVKTLS